ncbi:MAG: isopentenyl phosphate kinase [Halanaeroarchaeum sp.]
MTTVLKLGGSVLTDKDRREIVDATGLSRAVRAIAAADVEDLVIVHGGGSYGHPNAADRNVSAETGTRDAADVRAIHRAMGTLLHQLTDELGAAGVPAVPVRPLSGSYRTRQGDVAMDPGPVATMLGEGFVPVLHGDVVASVGEGATIASGDELVVSLAAGLGADRVGLCSSVPGVLDEAGDVIPHVEEYGDVAAAVGESAATDVTGGMAGKVRALLETDASASIFGLDDLTAFLAGERPGTTIE